MSIIYEFSMYRILYKPLVQTSFEHKMKVLVFTLVTLAASYPVSHGKIRVKWYYSKLRGFH